MKKNSWCCRDIWVSETLPEEPVVEPAEVGDASVYQAVPDEAAAEPKTSTDGARPTKSAALGCAHSRQFERHFFFSGWQPPAGQCYAETTAIRLRRR